MLKPIVYLLRLGNLSYYYLFAILEKFSPAPRWTQELSQYFKTSPNEIVQAYQQKRSQAAKLWTIKSRQQIKQIFSFYSETDYWVYRQIYFNRHKVFLDIALALFLKPQGRFCEYGGGVGPVTHWLINKFPKWQYQIIDLDCPVLKFSRWRFRDKPNVSFKIVNSDIPPLHDDFDVIVCKQVLEHVPDPLIAVKRFVKYLNPGGWLFVDYVNNPGRENLTVSAKKRWQVLRFLNLHLQPIFKINPNKSHEGYGLYVKKL